jgi:hypothetical protein
MDMTLVTDLNVFLVHELGHRMKLVINMTLVADMNMVMDTLVMDMNAVKNERGHTLWPPEHVYNFLLIIKRNE